MPDNPNWKAKKREGSDSPPFRKLGEMMNQGGGYSHADPPQGLSAQMNQGGGYHHTGNLAKLRKLMGQ